MPEAAFALLLLITGPGFGGPTQSVIYFADKDQCEAAYRQVVKEIGPRVRVQHVCIPRLGANTR